MDGREGEHGQYEKGKDHQQMLLGNPAVRNGGCFADEGKDTSKHKH
jgi:hypothetical protein